MANPQLPFLFGIVTHNTRLLRLLHTLGINIDQSDYANVLYLSNQDDFYAAMKDVVRHHNSASMTETLRFLEEQLMYNSPDFVILEITSMFWQRYSVMIAEALIDGADGEPDLVVGVAQGLNTPNEETNLVVGPTEDMTGSTNDIITEEVEINVQETIAASSVDAEKSENTAKMGDLLMSTITYLFPEKHEEILLKLMSFEKAHFLNFLEMDVNLKAKVKEVIESFVDEED